MMVIILASGVGKRLRPLTETIPKSLVKINGHTILEYQLDIVERSGIKKVVITTGPFEEKIKSLLKEKYLDLDIIFVHNPLYKTTNYIYSLWLTKNMIDDDVVLFHGDLVFSDAIFRRLLNKQGNFVLVHTSRQLPQKDFKAVIENQKVTKIGVNYFSQNALPSQPLYLFKENDFIYWMEAIESEVKKDNTDIYAEDVFNKISNTLFLRPLYYKDDFCMEIDTLDDLKEVKDRLVHL